jgi:hypothetical protein
MGYLDAIGTTARFAQPHAKDRVELARLAEEQAALRRVATLVARGASSTDCLRPSPEGVAQVLHLANIAVCRYDDNGTVMAVLAAYGERPDTFNPGSRWPLDGPSVSAEVLRTGRPARMEDYTALPGAVETTSRSTPSATDASAPPPSTSPIPSRFHRSIYSGRHRTSHHSPHHRGDRALPRPRLPHLAGEQLRRYAAGELLVNIRRGELGRSER